MGCASSSASFPPATGEGAALPRCQEGYEILQMASSRSNGSQSPPPRDEDDECDDTQEEREVEQGLHKVSPRCRVPLAPGATFLAGRQRQGGLFLEGGKEDLTASQKAAPNLFSVHLLRGAVTSAIGALLCIILVLLAMLQARGNRSRVWIPPWAPPEPTTTATTTTATMTTTTVMLVMDIDESKTAEMIVAIDVGTPPQRIRCLLDSGSSDLWIPSRRCHNCNASTTFAADKSTTFVPEIHNTPKGSVPRAIQITYTSGAIAGYAATDTVQFDAVTVENQSFIIVEAERMAQEIVFDGILGLGWADLAHWGTPLYERLREQGVEPVFTVLPAGVPVHRPRLGSQPWTAPRLVLGQVPDVVLENVSPIAWVSAENVSAKGGRADFRKYWLISGGVAVNQVQIFSPVTFLVDTGTNVALLVPAIEYKKMVDQLLPKTHFSETCAYFEKGITCVCSMLAEAALPSVSIILGGQSFLLPIATLFHKFRPGNCQLQIQPQFGEDPYWVLGAAFLETCVFAFDFERARMGFAKAAGERIT